MGSFIKKYITGRKIKWYSRKYSQSSPGSAAWLIGAEINFGGIQVNVPRNKVSPYDPRSKEEIQTGGMTGGDRFLHHGYAKKYEHYLKPYVSGKDPLTLIEVGILKGTGLAIWSELFPRGRIIGLDIDLTHFNDNREDLVDRGAFKAKNVELFEFDQFMDNRNKLKEVLHEDLVDVFIDDGFHSNEAILSTMKSALPFLSNNFVYFIEDNQYVHTEIRQLYPNLFVDNDGRLTIIKNTPPPF